MVSWWTRYLSSRDIVISLWKIKDAMEEKVQPLEDRILVKADKAETLSKGGLYIPEGAQEKPLRGEVVAIGPGKVTSSGALVPMTVKVGDNILYGRYSGTELKIGDKDYLIMRESDVYAVLEPEGDNVFSKLLKVMKAGEE